MRPKLFPILPLIFSLFLFNVASEAASYRPKLIGKMPFQRGAISPDEKWFVCADKNDNKFQIVNLKSLKIAFKIPLPRKSRADYKIYCFRWTSDSTTIAVGWRADSLTNRHVFDVGTIGISLYQLGHKTRVFEDRISPLADDGLTQIRFSPDAKSLWLASSFNFRAWDLRSQKLKSRFIENGSRDTSIPYYGALSTDGRTFLYVGQSGFEKFDTSTKKELSKPQQLYGLNEGGLEFSPDSSIIVHYDWRIQPNNDDPLVRVVETGKGRLLWKPATWPKFSPDSKFCLLSFPDRIEKRDARTGKLQSKFPPLSKNAHLSQIITDKAFYSMDDKGNLYRSRLK